jgi:beta-lactamase regulating signal transducer with metallopeptidase domain
MTMNNAMCLIASCVVNSLWEVAVIGGAGWAASMLLRRLGPKVEHVAWVATLVLAVLTPLLPVGRTLLALPQQNGVAQPDSGGGFVVAQVGAAVAGGGIVLPQWMIAMVSVCYLGCVLYFAMRLAWGMYRTAAMVRRGSPVAFGEKAAELWSRCRQAFAVGNGVVLTSHEVSGPVTAGVLRNVLLLPGGFAERCAADNLLTALAHESAHMERNDFRKNLLYEIASLLIAFHPVTWLVRSRIAQTREMICDAMATERMIDGRAYTESLLRLVTMIVPGAGVATTNAIGVFDANVLEKRIMILRTKKNHLSAPVRYSLGVLGAVVLLIAAGAGTMAVPVAAQGSKDATSAEMVIPLDPAVRKAAGAPNMDCTYYAKENNFKGILGTCDVQHGSSANYICTANPDTKLSQPPASQPQVVCGWKVERYRTWLKSHSGSAASDAGNNLSK